MTHSLAARLTAALSLVILCLSALSVALTGVSLRTWSHEAVTSRLAQDEAAWSRVQSQEVRALTALARVAAAGTSLQTVLSSGSVVGEHLEPSLRAQQSLLGVDLLLAVDTAAGVRVGTPPGALSGMEALVKEGGARIILVDEVPHQAVAQPVTAEGRTVGYVVLGRVLGEVELQALRDERGVEGVLTVGGRPVAHALSAVPDDALLSALEGKGRPDEVSVNGVSLQLRRVEMGPGVELLLTRDGGKEAEQFRASMLLVVLLGIIVTAAAGTAIFLLVRRMMEPLRELTVATTRMVSEGDFRGALAVRSKDEIGQLASSFSELMSQLRELLMALRHSAEQLETASTHLTESASVQNEAVSQQAVALHETQIAAQQLQEASRAAARRVEVILREADKASGFGEAGEAAVSGSVGGLTHIRSHVEQIGRTVAELHQRTRQVGDITRTVKDLADQSNVLALNASIEAARSGDSGRSFAVVARQMRSLADQSAGATTRVQSILSDIGRAISQTVSTSEGGAREVEGGLEQVRAAGESLRSLAGIIQSNGKTVRSIADAVSQQDAGIAELFAALSSMADLADQIVDRMAASEQSAIQLSAASAELSAIVGRYQL
ncbi:methyl-accepting chemotaxis protein [Myxococcus xanthus]|uniref:Chemotaxis protein n=1 Tax=Myxococcus xanthus TaxID=34 RepID=A0AAE6FWU8_MYXXA|nr:methyl-accepting chemotaxis protein [Myxococcus xanthus]QDE66776.1 chemotaxis protein [Myxococcus xanthus]QDE74049.1 chemotaxis protein [Myxococcus xanthus]QDE95644.1 chemotaxis protein [Myxococcus xanthus]